MGDGARKSPEFGDGDGDDRQLSIMVPTVVLLLIVTILLACCVSAFLDRRRMRQLERMYRWHWHLHSFVPELDNYDGEHDVELGHVGVGQEVLDSLPVFTYAGAGEGEPAAEAEQCSICLCDFEESEEGRQLTRCKHRFHRTCVDTWLRSHGASCPLCRTKVAPLKAAEAAAFSVELAMEMV